jgi:hypothetical protein
VAAKQERGGEREGGEERGSERKEDVVRRNASGEGRRLFVPVEVGDVSEAPGPDAVHEAEEDSEGDAQTADHDVSDTWVVRRRTRSVSSSWARVRVRVRLKKKKGRCTKERILAAEPADGREHDVLLAVELGRGVVCVIQTHTERNTSGSVK